MQTDWKIQPPANPLLVQEIFKAFPPSPLTSHPSKQVMITNRFTGKKQEMLQVQIGNRTFLI
jgi:hypothetical protein